VSSLVVSARMTSTSFMSGTGLKKCKPAKRSGRFVLAASSWIQSEDVFEQKIVPSATTASSTAKVFRFSSTFSMIASMIRSQPFKSSGDVVPDRLASVLSRASAVTLPFSTPSFRNLLTRDSPLSRTPCSTSRTIVL
jgi:hypothetical protein